MGMKTDLGKVRGLGSAKSGTEHFWHQRVTAIANVPLTLCVVAFGFLYFGVGRAEIISALSNPFWTVTLCAALINMCWHMKLGLQMVIEDYVHGAAKFALLLANMFFSFGLALLGVFAILKMSLGV